MLGLALFVQYWYWFPLNYAVSLAVQPTALIGVDASLRAPQGFTVRARERGVPACRGAVWARSWGGA